MPRNIFIATLVYASDTQNEVAEFHQTPKWDWLYTTTSTVNNILTEESYSIKAKMLPSAVGIERKIQSNQLLCFSLQKISCWIIKRFQKLEVN